MYNVKFTWKLLNVEKIASELNHVFLKIHDQIMYKNLMKKHMKYA